ncbi:MAG: DUF488 family protein [Candidatus Halalkalibacterium sp. M3_1C_030]
MTLKRKFSRSTLQGFQTLGGLTKIARDKDLILVYGAKDKEHNQAVVLKEYLEKNI